ncbi:lysine exporter protein LysE/YggA [Parageobacillus genomosp. 1]|uniref:Lysine exporter protein LysE/YggA n=1 Tax=Parageobacillus genomosp. 1 TaxID=1295642 RepID=A0ABC9VEP9_9BACL|nr:lysine exporter protein LysE/YggA [Parageobacillus genomosp. 1]
MLTAFIHGFILALGLILPLGAQNVFVFPQGTIGQIDRKRTLMTRINQLSALILRASDRKIHLVKERASVAFFL